MVQRLGLLPGLEKELRLDPKLDPQEGVGLLKIKYVKQAHKSTALGFTGIELFDFHQAESTIFLILYVVPDLRDYRTYLPPSQVGDLNGARGLIVTHTRV